MTFPLITLKRKDFLKKHNSTIGFSPKIEVQLPSNNNRILSVSHSAFSQSVVPVFDDSQENLESIYFDESTKEAKRFQELIDSKFKKSFFKYYTNKDYKEASDQIEKNYKTVIKDLWSPIESNKSAKSFIEHRQELLDSNIVVPDIPIFDGSSIFVVLLNQRYTLSNRDEEIVMLKEYKITSTRINHLNSKGVDYELSFESTMVDDYDQYTAYSTINILFDKSEENIYSLRQGYSNLRLFINEKEAKKYFSELKEEIVHKIS